ncbi:MAG: hypothetical protein ACOX9R_16375 [Armatimonadota bacterium]|jgi:predicted anti-sigma-YlaC factor YlaD
MKDCDAVRRLASSPDCEVGPEDDFEMLKHLAECEYCRQELRSVRRTAARVLMHSFSDTPVRGHLSDLDLAMFVAHGLDAPNAGAAVEHLSHCRQCRQQFRHAVRIIEQQEDLIYGEPPRARMPDRSFLDQVRLILSDGRRVGRALMGFLSWVCEWAMLLIVLYQIAAGYLADPGSIGRSAATEFLGVNPFVPLRFWVIAVSCTILAIFFRWLGAQLYHSAVEQEHPHH